MLGFLFAKLHQREQLLRVAVQLAAAVQHHERQDEALDQREQLGVAMGADLVGDADLVVAQPRDRRHVDEGIGQETHREVDVAQAAGDLVERPSRALRVANDAGVRISAHGPTADNSL